MVYEYFGFPINYASTGERIVDKTKTVCWFTEHICCWKIQNGLKKKKNNLYIFMATVKKLYFVAENTGF